MYPDEDYIDEDEVSVAEVAEMAAAYEQQLGCSAEEAAHLAQVYANAANSGYWE